MSAAKDAGARVGDDVFVAYCSMVKKYWLQRGEEIRDRSTGRPCWTAAASCRRCRTCGPVGPDAVTPCSVRADPPAGPDTVNVSTASSGHGTG
jgi:hypothetical protein